MISTTAYSKKYLEKEGYTCWKAESYNFYSGHRTDAFGFADILCLKEGQQGVLAVQTTSKNAMSARRKKIQNSTEADLWKKCGNPIHLHGWFKNKSNRYELKQEVL